MDNANPDSDGYSVGIVIIAIYILWGEMFCNDPHPPYACQLAATSPGGGPGEGCTCNHRQNGDKQHARFGKYITVYGSPKMYSGSNDI